MDVDQNVDGSKLIARFNSQKKIVFEEMPSTTKKFPQLYVNFFFNFRGFVAGLACGYTNKDPTDHTKELINKMKNNYGDVSDPGSSIT